MSDTLQFDILNAGDAAERLDVLIACYLDAYGGGDDFHSEDRYRRQITNHMSIPRWLAVTATDVDDGTLAGYIYGFSLPEQTRWWDGLTTQVPAGFSDEEGDRTVALSELMVLPVYRRRGIAHALHDRFIENRQERRATLLVRPDNTAAQTAYLSWGYEKVAELRPAWEHAPNFDVFMRSLR